jgi:hypothetical protein
MCVSETATGEVTNRLRRAEGQIRGPVQVGHGGRRPETGQDHPAARQTGRPPLAGGAG